MKKKTNVLILTLMISSMALLVILEGFWLRSSFVNEYHLLRREVNFLFRSTLFAMQDSVLQTSIKPLQRDSTGHPFIRKDLKIHDTLRFISQDKFFNKNIPVTRDNVQIFISSATDFDSIKSLMIRPLITRIRSDTSQKTFTIRIRGDSLRRADIRRNFNKALAEAAIDIPFEIKITSGGRHPDPVSQKVVTDWIPSLNETFYRASFGDVYVTILRKITPQILFSCVLSTLTAISFIFMYRSIRSQQRLVTIKNDLISNITHELKTPIATVSVALEALKSFNGIDNPQLTQEYLDIAQYELSRLTLLTDKVLTASLFDEHGIKLDHELVDLEKMVTGVFRSMKLVFEKRNAVTRIEKEGASFILSGSPVHLTNVVYNLLDNALKYSPSHPEITIVLKDLGDQVSFSISDKGVGVPEAYQQRIFEKFFRVPTGDVHTVKGHGLGLNYVLTVVKAHQGEIVLQSQPGEGSTFAFTVPKKTG